MKKRPKVRKRRTFAGPALVLLLALALLAVVLGYIFGGGLFVGEEPMEDGGAAPAVFQGRKNIYDRNFEPLAVSFTLASKTGPNNIVRH
jgi:hypothetical protein